ncbi:hypothetical protein [Rubellimicrobium mesophilum]|uniref:hypothetical protein n=1 Tax=Rubellimicrobium mesophilum TaxID=1123067 RepID=UPI001FE0C640|nr:hypothetical protein [Rubellimicrobium mesophilum]
MQSARGVEGASAPIASAMRRKFSAAMANDPRRRTIPQLGWAHMKDRSSSIGRIGARR